MCCLFRVGVPNVQLACHLDHIIITNEAHMAPLSLIRVLAFGVCLPIWGSCSRVKTTSFMLRVSAGLSAGICSFINSNRAQDLSPRGLAWFVQSSCGWWRAIIDWCWCVRRPLMGRGLTKNDLHHNTIIYKYAPSQGWVYWQCYQNMFILLTYCCAARATPHYNLKLETSARCRRARLISNHLSTQILFLWDDLRGPDMVGFGDTLEVRHFWSFGVRNWTAMVSFL